MAAEKENLNMSKVNQIENAIYQIEGGMFQKLCDSYISMREKKQITSTGSQDGTNKPIKGTPDSYYTKENGHFVFIEHTTQRSNLLSKINKDIEKCFDENKTGISKDVIDKIIYCHIDKLSASEVSQIITLCKKYNCDFENNDVSSISYELAHSYPQIAQDILDIKVETDQIILPERFVSIKSQTITLENDFYCREEEINEIKEALNINDIILISGEAGTGKTRIAIEIISIFRSEYPTFFCCCIENRKVPIYEDFLLLYKTKKKILILIDDANRLAQLEPIL